MKSVSNVLGLCLAAAISASSALAQAKANKPVAAVIKERFAQIDATALVAFKKGDVEAGIQALRGRIITHAKAPNQDFQIAKLLSHSVYLLLKDDPNKTNKTTPATVSGKLNASKVPSLSTVALARKAAALLAGPWDRKVSKSEEAEAYTLAGDLQQAVLNNTDEAKNLYERAAKADPKYFVARTRIRDLQGPDRKPLVNPADEIKKHQGAPVSLKP